MISKVGKFITTVFEEYKAARRITLFWALWLITVVVLRVTSVEVILGITPAGATVVGSVVGILATVIAFYQWHRSKDNNKEE